MEGKTMKAKDVKSRVLVTPKTRSGFTLIELLIVVAIIAILAAIAIPNFLEAQTRSKVARVKADLSTLMTAFEAYNVDHNVYPYFNIYSFQYPGWQQGGFVPERITTPVAYITTIPIDRFNIFYKSGGGGIVAVPDGHPWTRYRGQIRKPLPAWPGIENPTIDDQTTTINAYGAFSTYHDFWEFGICRPLGVPPASPFFLCSPGPDKQESTWPAYYPMVYDPSNGTISFGDIAKFGSIGEFH
jgi:prepilin-type N-terminal cleavage/methylation domain-containing protein